MITAVHTRLDVLPSFAASSIVRPEVPVVAVPVGLFESSGAVPVVAAGTSEVTAPGGLGTP